MDINTGSFCSGGGGPDWLICVYLKKNHCYKELVSVVIAAVAAAVGAVTWQA